MNNNIFTTLLRYINVPFTEKYASEAYFFQPYRNTMYGLMQLLNKYKINNECIEFADKADVLRNSVHQHSSGLELLEIELSEGNYLDSGDLL